MSAIPREPRSIGTPPGWAGDLCHPLPLGAVLVLAVNDHLLKGAGLLPGWLTGKLSDFAGLFFFPLLLSALAAAALALLHRVPTHVDRGTRERGVPTHVDRAPLTAGATALTAAVFAAIKLSPAANAWVSSVWGPMRLDPTDLVALPMTLLSYAWARRRARGVVAGQRVVQAAGVIAAALASLATSAPRPPVDTSPHPRAAVTPPCARIRLLGCEHDGHRLTALVEVVSEGSPECRVQLTSASEVRQPQPGQLHTESSADVLPGPLELRAGERRAVTIAWSRPFPVRPGEERFSLEVQGRQWVNAAGAGEPAWEGLGTIAGTCERPRPRREVAQ